MRDAVAMAQAQAAWQKVPVEIETLYGLSGSLEMPHRVDPFALGVEGKNQLAARGEPCRPARGAQFCRAGLHLVRERKWLANTFGSRLVRSRLRVHPTFNVTVLDERRGDSPPGQSRATSRQPS
ncbi:MAG: hypothetical protein R3F31_13200 [Verrucomicrobiales bacterium]